MFSIIFIFALFSHIHAKMYLVETEGKNDGSRKRTEMMKESRKRLNDKTDDDDADADDEESSYHDDEESSYHDDEDPSWDLEFGMAYFHNTVPFGKYRNGNNFYNCWLNWHKKRGIGFSTSSCCIKRQPHTLNKNYLHGKT